MTTNEIRERFTPRKCETQKEYRELYAQIDWAQSCANHPLYDRAQSLKMEATRLHARIASIKIELSAIYNQVADINRERKEINRAFHEVKNEFARLNPKEELVQDSDEENSI